MKPHNPHIFIAQRPGILYQVKRFAPILYQCCSHWFSSEELCGCVVLCCSPRVFPGVIDALSLEYVNIFISPPRRKSWLWTRKLYRWYLTTRTSCPNALCSHWIKPRTTWSHFRADLILLWPGSWTRDILKCLPTEVSHDATKRHQRHVVSFYFTSFTPYRHL